MKALVYNGPNDIRLMDIDKPQLGSSKEVCIRVKAVSICGSDLSGYKGTSKFREPPLVMGHEFSGDIVTIGKDVTDLRIGQRVTVNPNLYCGKCHNCLEGRTNLCSNRKTVGTKMPAGKYDGAMAEYLCVPATAVIPLRHSVSYEEAALLEPLAVSLHAVKQARHLAGGSVAVVGAGPIGLLAVQCAKQLGAATVIALDLVDERLDRARQLGADIVINSNSDFLSQVKDVTNRIGVAAAIDAVGVSNSLSQCMQMVRDGGDIVLVGLGSGVMNVDTYELVCREISIQGSYIYREEMQEGMEMVANGDINVIDLITSVLPLEKGPETFARLASGRTNDIKVVLQSA